MANPGTWQVELGILKDRPVPVLLGRDWPGFEELLAMSVQSNRNTTGCRSVGPPDGGSPASPVSNG